MLISVKQNDHKKNSDCLFLQIQIGNVLIIPLGGITHGHWPGGMAKPRFCNIDPCTGVPQCGQRERKLATWKWGMPNPCPNNVPKLPPRNPFGNNFPPFRTSIQWT